MPMFLSLCLVAFSVWRRMGKHPISDKCELQVSLDSYNHYSMIKSLSKNFDSGRDGCRLIIVFHFCEEKKKKQLDENILFNCHQATLTYIVSHVKGTC